MEVQNRSFYKVEAGDVLACEFSIWCYCVNKETAEKISGQIGDIDTAGLRFNAKKITRRQAVRDIGASIVDYYERQAECAYIMDDYDRGIDIRP